MKYCIVVLLFLSLYTRIQGQFKTHKQEINIITDNDNYDLELTDRYYSNGFILQYNRAVSTGIKGVVKKINRFEAGHKVYNPFTNRISAENVRVQMDRPYAGWLYGSFGSTFFTTKQHVVEYTAAAGIMGPSALGKEVQQGWHKFIGLYQVYGWEYQLNNSIGLNASGAYYHNVVNAKETGAFTMHLVSKAELGTIFSNASAGLLLKTGSLNKEEQQSGYWSGQLGADAKTFNRKEFIFFAEPLLQYQLYNATVQGTLFSTDKGPFTTGIQPLLFQLKTGMMLTGNAVGLRWYYTFRGREGSSMRKAEHWGTIGLSVRF